VLTVSLSPVHRRTSPRTLLCLILMIKVWD